MSVLKYQHPTTGEWKKASAVKVVETGEAAPVVASEQLKASVYPDHITPEVIDMVNRVNAVRKDSSIVFLAMSDPHYPADQTATTAYASNVKSSLQANQAAKALTYLLRPDFFAHLGDVATGAGSTTPDMLRSQIEGFLSYFREAKSDLPVFLAIGNHDTGIYYHDTQTDGKIYTMSGKYLYDNFTARSDSPDTVFGDASFGGYCYRDFPEKKLRVFLLNTSEKLVSMQTDSTTYGKQRAWLANALLDLNSKSDATEWGFIILCHYPADYGATMPLSELLRAYVEGASHTVSDPSGDGTNETVSFSGKNGARFIAQFHGHVHNFLSSKLYSNTSGTPAQYDAWRVCIPNVQFDRENYYETVGGVNFKEDVTYPKTADTSNGTSFVVNVINPSEKKIYSFCYGAGYDRVIGFGSAVYYSIASKLSGVTSSNDALSVEADSAYSTVLTPSEGYELKSVTVTMDGKDITATAYNNGTVTISRVTGNVVITAKAQAHANFTNLVPLSINADGSDFNGDGDGYDNDTYVNSSGAIAAKKGSTSTGFIPVTPGAKIIRIAGEGLSIDQTYTRIASYDADFDLIANSPYMYMGIQHSSGVYYQGKLINEDSTLITLELEKASILSSGVYLRVCTNGDGAELVVTVDEEITYG